MKSNLLSSIQNRFSPMIFNERHVSDEDLDMLFSAASWAASSFNAQPWFFIFEKRESEGFSLLQSLLTDYNQQWTSTAQVLILTLSRWIDEKERENDYALYDLGQAVSSLALQASSMGLQIHQMGGFDHDKTRELLKIPSDFKIGTMIALGYPGDIDLLEDPFRKRALQERVRKEISEISANTDVFRK